MFLIALTLILISLILLWLSTRQRKQAGLPGGKIIYIDTQAWGKVEKPFYDAEIGLTGKPDYLIEQNGLLIPVEVKSGRAPSAPYDSHIYQVAAYCLLVQRSTGKRPPYGIIHYNDRDFSIDYTPQLENSLLDVLAEMRRDEIRSSVNRSHEIPARCARCGYRDNCDQSLA